MQFVATVSGNFTQTILRDKIVSVNYGTISNWIFPTFSIWLKTEKKKFNGAFTKIGATLELCSV